MGLTPALFTSAKPDGTDPTKLQPSFWNRVTALLNSLLNGSETHGSVLYRDTADATDGSSYAASAAGVLACAGAGQAPAFRALTTTDLPASASLSLFTSTTPVANVGTAETNLITYPMPGNTLAVNGQKVRITAYFTSAANVNNKTLKMYFGSTVIYTTGAIAFSNRTHKIVGEVFRTGATVQAASSTYLDSNGSGGMGLWNATLAETLSGSVTIKTTGTSGTGSNDITCTAMFVELVP